MKALLALAALSLSLIALAPPAQAQDDPQVALVACSQDFGGGRAVAVPIALGVLCVDPTETWCTAWIEWTAIPQTPTCLVAPVHAAAAIAPPAVELPPVDCMPYERRIELGPLTVVQGGCGNDVELCGHSLLAVRELGDLKPIMADCREELTPAVQCSDIYARHEVGQLAVVMTSGCSGHVEVCDTPVLQGVDTRCVLVAVAEPTAASIPEPMCMQVYRETEAGPVRQVSRDSCHSEVYVCDNDGSHGADETAREYLLAQAEKPDANGFVQCAWESTGLVGPVLW